MSVCFLPERIHRYFGDTIAMYFAFLGFYTMALVPPALIGVISYLVSGSQPSQSMDLLIFFCIFNLIWATLFLESWKRHCATLAYKWGTIRSEPFEEARPAYHGTLGVNQVTGRLEPRYPKWKRAVKFYCVSVPVVLACLSVAFLVMLWYFWLEDIALYYHQSYENTLTTVGLFLPTVIYAILISVMNALYRKLAKLLNDWGELDRYMLEFLSQNLDLSVFKNSIP